jgi:hypothetical protein
MADPVVPVCHRSILSAQEIAVTQHTHEASSSGKLKATCVADYIVQRLGADGKRQSSK